jgi:transposase
MGEPMGLRERISDAWLKHKFNKTWRERQRQKCAVCGYRAPADLQGAIFMGPGGLHRCAECHRCYCNEHAKRVKIGDSVTLLNCPKCGEQLKPI